MKPPNCKLCKSPHWTYEEHTITDTSEEARKVGAGVLRNTVTKRNNVTPVTKPVLSDGAEASSVPPIKSALSGDGTLETGGSSAPSPSAGRPKKHKSNAERQRAYRERSRG